ncbi:restriction endonuclease subunit S [Aeromonas hydrophila]|uniref:restriction endonuclease subunit S n=1 Tax=Aeromonas hydrophila TaxID=644 RepID=UPI002379F0A6|nr:restriction endonuclease subunit S [Aeromonas hydrophila]MDD9227513.1 restriction endonuclease subunit S [Aeromonas hydrophila]
MAEQVMQEAAGKAIPAGYKQTEVGVIPEEWDVATIEELADIIDPQPDHRTPPESSNGEPYIGISDFINSREVDWTASRKIISKAVDKQRKCFQLQKGDIVFGKIGTIGVPKFVPQVPFRFALSANVILLQPKNVEPIYLMGFFYSELFQKTLKSELHSTSQAAFGMNKMRVIKLPLPPKEEQTAIANVLSDSDALIDALEQLISKKQAIKSAAMQQLLTGRTRLPAFALHPDGTPKGYKPSELGDIPEDWDVAQLGEIVKLNMGQSPSSSNYNNKGIGMPLIQGNADILNRKTIIRNYTSQITKKAKKGDLILSVRAPVGEVAKAEFDCCIGRGVCAVQYKNDYLYQWLVSFETEWDKFSKGSTFDSINSEELRHIELIMPSDEEQTAIATILSDMDNELQTLTQKLEKARALKQGMMQQLLTGKIRLPLAAGAQTGA